jgi:hypothetical protein
MKCTQIISGPGPVRCGEVATERFLWPRMSEWTYACERHASKARDMSAALGVPMRFEAVEPDAEEELLIICLRSDMGNPGGFDDNVYGPCAKCGAEIQHRPHVPEPSTKVCLGCFAAHVKKGDRVGVTAETADELKRWSATQK